jgi:tetratricopeptide (TPR) repeat protein
LCEAAGEEGRPLLTVALIGVASGASATGDFQTAYTIGGRLIDVYRELGDLHSLGVTIMIQGEMAIGLGKYNAAQLLLEESMALARAAGDKYRIALTINFLGDLAHCERRVVQAHSAYEESLSLLRELGAARDIPATLHNLAYIELDVIGNKILELPAQMILAMANAQIVQTGCRFHETI